MVGSQRHHLEGSHQLLPPREKRDTGDCCGAPLPAPGHQRRALSSFGISLRDPFHSTSKIDGDFFSFFWWRRDGFREGETIRRTRPGPHATCRGIIAN
ncbi:hypothetical protein PVAP13_9KG418711 [Panicum virgatum]|uniref:Uncharacterized protein n=1 Tax=Panicum virgatum TaxID=38727 RepID=A0A8T0N617_PANVG|nr:hypothetical protein PVAP13_9KG418711 [Panicum virgatum]